jgi:5-methylcytosine-specific restriction enzyme subunit McrC
MQLRSLAWTEPLAQSTKIIQAFERGECSLSLTDFLDGDGAFRLLEFAQNRIFVEVRHAGDSLKLRIGGIVGRLPLNEKMALDIEPKFPIQNLSRIIERARISGAKIAPIDRIYKAIVRSEYSTDALVRSFAVYLRELLQIGIHKGYERSARVGQPRPRLDIRRTQQLYWSRGDWGTAAMVSFDLTADNEVNRLLKRACMLAYSLARGMADCEETRATLREGLLVLARVDASKLNLITFDAVAALRSVPSFREKYNYVIPIAMTLLRGGNILHESALRGLEMPSFLIEMDPLFECYIRNTLHSHFEDHESEIFVRDGNLPKWQRKLLRDNHQYPVKPDIVFLRRSLPPLAIADVKYKPKPREEDRYQIIAHALSYQVKRAVLIYPAAENGPSGMRRLGQTGADGHAIDLYEYYFDLAADLQASEAAMSAAFELLVSTPPN